MKLTNIEWTDLSSNPIQYRDRRTGRTVWGCVKHSAGCASCYAESIALRFGRGGPFTRGEMEHLEPFLDDKEVHHMLTAKTIGGKAVAGSRCFAGDMTDCFGDWIPDALLDRLFAVMALRQDVTWQVLTKRAERMADYLSHPGRQGRVNDAAAMSEFNRKTPIWFKLNDGPDGIAGPEWPLRNVWLGTSVENQATADARIPHLLRVPAAVRFLSCEPLLDAVDLTGWGEAAMRNDPAAEPTTWADYPWPGWVPADQRKQVEEFWSASMGRNPRQWVESAAGERVPAMGARIGAVVGKSGWGDLCPARSPDATVTGRYLHSWNNIGRVVTDDGRVVPVSSHRGTGWLSKWVQPDDSYKHRLHWVIVGCESGPNRRPMADEWAASLVGQCRAAGVACFVKQVEVGGKVSGEVEVFPLGLRVREFPEGKAS